MRIGEILNGVYDEDVGWRPSTGSIKPVHIANGLARAIVGRSYNTEPIVSLISWENQRTRQPIEGRTTRDLLEQEVYASFRGHTDEFERLRHYARGVLAADKAVFPSAKDSSLTLSCKLMVSADPMDRGLGAFAAVLLGDPRQTNSLAKIVADALEVSRPEDPITALVWPLLDQSTGQSAQPPQLAALETDFSRPIVKRLQRAAMRLAQHELHQGNRLRTLQRATSFAVAATLAHAQALSVDGKLDRRCPLVLSTQAKGTPISDASEASLDKLFRNVETWLGRRLAIRIRGGQSLNPPQPAFDVPTDSSHALAILRELGPAQKKLQIAPAPILQARERSFSAALHSAGGDVPTALASALVEAYRIEYESGGPRKFLQGMATRAGLLYPHFQGASRQKRLAPNVLVTDMLVRACVPVDRQIPLNEFLDNLWNTFGIIVGGRDATEPTDFELLRASDLDVEPSALSVNTERFVNQLIEMGLARRLADNVTFVGVAHDG